MWSDSGTQYGVITDCKRPSQITHSMEAGGDAWVALNYLDSEDKCPSGSIERPPYAFCWLVNLPDIRLGRYAVCSRLPSVAHIVCDV